MLNNLNTPQVSFTSAISDVNRLSKKLYGKPAKFIVTREDKYCVELAKYTQLHMFNPEYSFQIGSTGKTKQEAAEKLLALVKEAWGIIAYKGCDGTQSYYNKQQGSKGLKLRELT